MRVANRKCIRRISIQHMRSAKTRNIITILAIVLTTVLFTALFTTGMSMKYGYEQSNFRQVGGYSHGGFKNITRDKVDELKDDSLIKEYGERLFLGMPMEAPFHKSHVEMSYCDANNARWMFIEPIEGRLPEEGTNEAATDMMVLSLLGVEPVIGNEFIMTFMVDGVETTETFTLCGYWEYDPVVAANHVLLPRSRVESILDKLDTQGYDHLAGYWCLNVIFRSANAIEENLKKILERHGYQSEDEAKDDYVSIGINWGYIAAQLDDGFDMTTVLALAAAVILIIFTGYLIIYNIFQIAVSNDVRFYGLLKTIGTTGRQIKRIILIQACVLSAVGIPIGLAFGYALGRAVTHVVVAEMADGGMMEVYSVSPFIFVGAAVFSLITVLLSCRKPRKMAAKVSPIEALRYTEGSQSRKTVRKAKRGASVLKMAWANLGRNRKKTVVTIISLSLAIVILELTYILSSGFSMDKYLRRMTQDFVLAEASHFQASTRWGADTAVSEDVIAQIETMEGVTGGRTYGMTSVIQEFVTEDWLRFLKRDSGSGKALDAYISYREKTGDKLMSEIHLYGMEDFVLDKLIVVDGDVSKLKEGGNYVAAVCRMDDYYNVETDSHWAKVGDKISLRYVDKFEYYDPETGEVYAGDEDLRMKAVAYRAIEYKDAEYEVCARVAIPNTLNYRFYGADEFVMGADTFREETETDAILYYAFDCDDDKIDDMEKYMEEFTERNDWYDYESKQSYAERFYGMRNMFVFVGTALGFIVGMIGILNFLNAILTGILTRRKEFAVLQSVGMTGRQLNTMLMIEGVIFAGSSVVITLLMSIVLAPLVRNVLEDMFWFFNYRFTVVPVAAIAPVFALLGASLPLAAYRYVAKKSVVERLREAE
ncbi:MAG: ABC transporter permease [Lachnospiraceae bacterium]|nr:ABC transporter permease [Lachnospiraceae bacterium]